jgi:hypothetical protein
MALESNLLKFKSSGVKQLLEIAEPIPTITIPTGARLLIINSRKGRVNYPITVADYSDYISKFDAINDADERRGNFSARTAKQMLNQGPIYVLNLRKFDDTIDTAGIVELSTSFSTVNNAAKTKPFKKLFNTQQFWKIDKEALLNNTNTEHLLVFGNIGTKAVSIFVRKSKTIQFNQTFQTWYSSLGREMPSYVIGTDKVKDWMVDVVIFNNTFDATSQSNHSYGYCFDADGNVKKEVVNSSNLTVDGLTQLSAISESGYVGTFTGSLVQGFKDETGNNIDIIDIINSYVEKTGIIVYRNESIFDESGAWSKSDATPKKPIPVDFKGHSIVPMIDDYVIDEQGYAALKTENNNVSKNASYQSVNSIELSAVRVLTDFDDITSTKSIVPNDSVVSIKAYIPAIDNGSGKAFYTERNKLFAAGEDFKPSIGDGYLAYDGLLATVISVKVVGQVESTIRINNEKLAFQPFGLDNDFSNSRFFRAADGTATFAYASAGLEFPKSPLGYYIYPTDHFLAGLPVVYSKMVDGVATDVVHNPSSNINDWVLPSTLSMTKEEYLATLQAKKAAIENFTESTQMVIVNNDLSMQRYKKSALVDPIKLNTLRSLNGVSFENIYEVTTDKNLWVEFSDATNPADTTKEFSIDVYEDANSKKLYFIDVKVEVKRINGFDKIAKAFVPINLSSYIPRNVQFLDGTAERQNEVLSVLTEVSIDNGLQNQDLINWMYIVDGFKSYIEPNIKYQLKDAAKKRITARALYNLPFIKDLARSSNPYFSSTVGGDLEMKYVAQGGNFELPYSNYLSLPIEDGYFAYGFSAVEGQNEKVLPSAGLVSNEFARKHQIGKPFMILAGNPDGIISGEGIVGPEYIFVEKNDGTGDRDYLEPAGWNIIMKKSGLLQIYANKTSFVTVNSPVSSIHTSEVIMYLQLKIKSLLENFVFKYNTANNRLRIVEQANDICNEPLGAGVISGFVNKMDDKNNTKEVIANRIGILDTTIYANNGMEILVHRTKIDIDTNTATFEVL